MLWKRKEGMEGGKSFASRETQPVRLRSGKSSQRCRRSFRSTIALDFAGHTNDPTIARISVEYRSGWHSDATTREIFGFVSNTTISFGKQYNSYPAICVVRMSLTIMNFDARYAFYATLIIVDFREELHIHSNVLAYN